MENIDKVTEYIRAKKPNKTLLHFHHTTKRKTYLFDENGFWRLFNYILSTTYNTTQDMSVIRNAGEAFGELQTPHSSMRRFQIFTTRKNAMKSW